MRTFIQPKLPRVKLADNSDDLRAAQWVISHGSAKRGVGDE